MVLACCQGRVMPGPSGLYRRHTCRARFGERYDAPRQTSHLTSIHRAETARTGIATLTHPSLANTDLAHWTHCEIEFCPRCDYIDAHMDDED